MWGAAACLVAFASPTYAQAPVRRSWFTTVGEVRASEDGWVELRIAPPSPVPPHNSEFSGVLGRFTPDTVRRWVDRVRLALDDTVRTVGTTELRLEGGFASLVLTVERDSARTSYELRSSSCRGGANAGRWRGDVILLANALAEAARAAAAFRATPADRGVGPFSLAEVTCPAWNSRAAMPAWSAAFGRRPAARAEALARFVVTEDGRIDLATLAWDRPPAPGPAQAARAALAEWRYERAIARGSRARQWTHAVVWFADSSDAAERQQAGWTRTRSFVARRDGRIEHAFLHPLIDTLWRPDEEARMREAYPPAAVRSWLSRPPGPEGEGPALTVPGGLTLHGGIASTYYEGCHAYPRLGTGGIPTDARPVLIDSVRAAIAAAERVPLRRVDTARVHGETEVTCPARPRGALQAALAHWRGPDEAVLSFVVRRDGRVDPVSVVALGDADPQDLAVARAALLAQAWEPGRLSGVRVSQRAHLVLYPDTRSPDLAVEACAQSSIAAVRLRVREPAGGIAPYDLTRVAHAMSRRLGLQAGRPATDGTFSVVLDDVDGAHFFAWISPPADTAGARIVRSAMWHQRIGDTEDPVVPSLPVSVLAVEGDLLRACP